MIDVIGIGNLTLQTNLGSEGPKGSLYAVALGKPFGGGIKKGLERPGYLTLAQ